MAKAVPAPISRPEEESLADIFRTCNGAFIAAGVFSFVVNILILTMPMYMFSLFDRVLGSGNLFTLAMLALMAFAALGIQALVDIARTFVFVQVSMWIDRRIGRRLLEHSIELALPRGASRSPDLQYKLMSLRSFLAGQQIYMAMDAPWIPIFLAVLFILNVWIGLTALIITLMIFGLALIQRLTVDPTLARASQTSARSLGIARMAVGNADVVHTMGMSQRLLDRWSVFNDRTLESQAIASRRSGIIQAFVKMLRMSSMMAVMTVSAVQIINPESGLSRGAMMASAILVGRCLAPIEAIVSGWDNFGAALNNYRELAAALRSRASRVKDFITPSSPKGLIRAINLTFKPAGWERNVVENVNFTLQPGESLGIVGASGSGKSTLARLLVGLETPSYGKVRLDGGDIHLWPPEEFGSFVGYLPQDVELLPGTVVQNISRFSEDVDRDAVLEAAEIAGVHDLVQRFPEGYETQIGEGGGLLSGGQRQRIGLARALYGNVKFVVLDEPNANLDVVGEQALAAAIERLKERGVTVIVILHRPNILKSVDHIMVMREGRVQKLASRDEMLPLIDGSVAGKPRTIEGNNENVALANQAQV